MFGISAALLLAAGVFQYRADSRADRLAQEHSERLNLMLGEASIVRDLDGVVSDLLYLAEHNEYQGLFDADNRLRLTTLAMEFQVFSKQKGRYDQIRLLDERGREVVRVNYHDGDPRAVPAGQLQNKGDRYYFKASLALPRGRVYVSPLDLNVEDSHIEQPPRPTLRFGTPVFDAAGRRQGVLLLNYRGDALLANFRQAAGNIADHAMLLNTDGYWLSHPDAHLDWGFMYGREDRFATRYPQAWQRILAQPSGQFRSAKGLFTFTSVYPPRPADSLGPGASDPGTSDPVTSDPGTSDPGTSTAVAAYWKIVAHVPAPGPGLSAWLRAHLLMYALMLALLGSASLVLAHARLRQRRISRQVEFEQRFRVILENIDLLAVGLDPQGTIGFCNDALLARTGWQREQVMHKNWFDNFIPDTARKPCRALQRALVAGSAAPHPHECEILTRDGERRLVSWNDALLRDAGGRVVGITWIGEDITEARRAEQERAKLYRAVEQSPSTVMIVDQAGLIEYVNPKFTQLTGYTLDEVKGRNPRILKSGETGSGEYATLWQTLLAGGEWRGVFHNRKKNGELYWEAAVISGMRDTDGRISHFIAVKEDITERRLLQDEVEARNRERAQNQALAATGRMASMIAHDLRNPLSSVKMTLQILGNDQRPAHVEEAQELREIALQQVRYMEEILEDLLAYSRPDALKPEWLSIDKLLNTAVLLTQRAIDQAGVGVKLFCPSGLPTLHGDPGKLKQAFSNLLLNAVQATEGLKGRPPRITVSAQLELADDRPRIRVEICDNGRGIAAGQAEQLFEPFFTTRAKGTGLGLAIVKRIVEQHHGSVALAPADDGGTCAVVILPTAPLEETRSGPHDTVPPAPETAAQIQDNREPIHD